MSCKTRESQGDPLQDSDPWMVQDSKGRVKPEPQPRQLGAFFPPGFGLSQIEPSSDSPKNEIVSFGGPFEREFAQIQETLEESLSENDKRELALERATSAGVPWLRHRKSGASIPVPDDSTPIRRVTRTLAPKSNVLKFGAHFSCSDSCCSTLNSLDKDFRGRSGEM